MKYIKKFESFTSAAEPVVKPGTKEPPTKPARPASPSKPIVRPSTDPEPKAEKVTELDVAKRFIDEVNKKGESVKKYLK
jgi:hypothetical protein